MVYTIYAIDHLNGANGAQRLLYSSSMNDVSLLVSETQLSDEMGKASVLKFKIYSGHALYGSLNPLNTEIVAYEDSAEIFRGRVYESSTGLYKDRSISCEGDIAYLNDSIQNPDKIVKTTSETVKYDGSSESYKDYDGEGTVTTDGSSHTYETLEEDGTKETVEAHFRRLISVHNGQVEAWKRFTVRNVTVDEKGETVTFDASNYRDTMNAIKSDLIDYYGGYLRTERVGSTTYIDWLKEYGTTCSQQLTFGQNIVDITEDWDSKDIFTGIIPVGKDDLTIAGQSYNSGGITVDPQNNKALIVSAGVNAYGRIYKTESFSDISDAGQLVNMAVRYINKNYKATKIKFTIDAVNLRWLNSAINSFRVGEQVYVNSPPHNLAKYVVCLKRDINFSDPEKSTYTLGDPSDDISTKVSRGNRQNSNSAHDANSSARAAGGAAGHLYKTLKEIGNDLYITADKVEMHTKRFDIFTTNTNKALVSIHDDVVEINGTIKAWSAVFQVTETGGLLVNGLLSAPNLYINNGSIFVNGKRFRLMSVSQALKASISVGVSYDTASVINRVNFESEYVNRTDVVNNVYISSASVSLDVNQPEGLVCWGE